MWANDLDSSIVQVLFIAEQPESIWIASGRILLQTTGLLKNMA
jgi:hypothetical protein